MSESNGAETQVETLAPPAEPKTVAEPAWPAAEPVELAQFPEGLWKGIDYLLHNPDGMGDAAVHRVGAEPVPALPAAVGEFLRGGV